MDTTPLPKLIENYLAATGISPTHFGWHVMGDPKFVFDLRKGRRVRPDTDAKARRHIDANPPPSRTRTRKPRSDSGAEAA